MTKRKDTVTRQIKDHFVPHSGNNYLPHALKHRVLLGYSALLIILKLLALVAPLALPSSSLYSSAITPSNIVALTNQTRKNLNLAVLSNSDLLSEAAQQKANDMVNNGYFAHTSPAGVSPWEWFKKAGYEYRHAGENLAVRFQSAEGVTDGWLASPTHRANIVNPRYSEIGVAVVNGTYHDGPATYVVQLFGQPAIASTVTVPEDSTTTQPDETAGLGTGSTVAGAETNGVPATSGLNIDDSLVNITPGKDSYHIRATIKGATLVTASLGDDDITLRSTGDDIWEGDIAFTPVTLARNGESLRLTASANNAAPVTKVVALVAPEAPTQNFYTFHEGADRFTTLFGGLRITNLDDSVRKVYFAFVVLLGAGLMFNVFFLQLHRRHPSVIGHTLAVLTLAIILTII